MKKVKKLQKWLREYEMTVGGVVILAWLISMFIILPLLIKVIFPLLEKWGFGPIE